MALLSNLFKGDVALEKCLVSDPAHVKLGASGNHVGKIQKALILLDDAHIAAEDLLAKKYGQSTANSVLGYKSKRRIINFSYQKAADNVVGKMTIAALDREMVALESRSVTRPGCDGSVGAGGLGIPVARLGFALRTSTDSRAVSSIEDQIIPKSLSIIWLTTAGAAAQNSTLFKTLLPKAGDFVSQFGMLISHNGEGAPTIPSNDSIGVDHVDALFLRKQAEKVASGAANALRVIVCPIRSEKAFAFTSGKGFDPSQPFQNYVLINANKFRPDKCTLIHEMVHAATNLPEAFHDSNLQSVFSIGPDRTKLRPEHAFALNNSFFAG